MKNIAEAALLVQMKVSAWGAQKTDHALSGQVTQDTNAQAGAYRVVKQVIPKRFLEPIHATTHQLRKTFKNYTLPWLTDGTGILPITLHEKFTNEYLKHQGRMERQVEDLVSNMPTVRLAAETYSGKGYDPKDVPSDEQIRDMFRVSIRFMPVPTANDFRVQMNEEVVEALKAQYKEELEDQINAGTAHAFMRVVEVLDRMIDGLERHGNVKSGGKRAGFFKNRAIENVRELSDILDDLNVAGDENLDYLASEIRSKINGIGPDDLRNDKQLREMVVEDAKAIRDQAKESVGGFFGVSS